MRAIEAAKHLILSVFIGPRVVTNLLGWFSQCQHGV